LYELFKNVGFKKVSIIVGAYSWYVEITILPIRILERLLQMLPYRYRGKIANLNIFKMILGIRIIGEK
jgi:hypothetical protein